MKMMENLDFTKEPLEISPKSGAPSGIKSVFDFDDFGRESLGILDVNHADFGRESLGIINLNNVDLGRESLGITKWPETTSSGAAENISLNAAFRLSSVCSSNDSFKSIIDHMKNQSDIMNNAFLLSQRISVSSSVSTFNSVNPSFNSVTSENSIPSKIFSPTPSFKSDFMNEAFMGSDSLIQQLQVDGRSSLCTIYEVLDKKIDKNVNKIPQRIASLSATLEDGVSKKLDKIESKEGVKANSLEGEMDIALSLNDSVFMEADLISTRIEKGTIYEDLDPDYMLDSTREPADFSNLPPESDSKESMEVKTNKTTAEVFKTVDQMFISQSHQTTSEVNISRESNKTNSKSKEARDILNSLSAILNTDEPNEQQISEGQNLLSSLAEILLSSGSSKSEGNQNLDDSGHSSIESEPVAVVAGVETHDCYEVLDLRKKSSSDTNINATNSYENCAPLDLSLKSRSGSFTKPNPKILPSKFSNQLKPNFNLLIENKSTGGNYSTSRNESRNSDNKFKPKKIETKGIKKGPMKAVVPIDSMAKRSGKVKVVVTPTRLERKSNFNLNKTSTPMSQSNLKPMAQSTPEGSFLKPGNQKGFYQISPLEKPSTSTSSGPIKQKLNYSGENSVNTKNVKNPFVRRYSGSDLKKSKKVEKVLLRRSFSSGSASYLKKPGENNVFTPKKKFLKDALLENKNLTGRKEIRTRKTGKENTF